MVFANLYFIYFFLALNLICYFSLKKIEHRNVVLVVFSFFFYAWGEPVWVLLLLTSALFDYMNGLLIERFRGTIQAKIVLAFSLCLNLGILATFKYSGFLVENINAVTGLSLDVPNFALPIGISFYTFQTISYVIDVYRGDTKAQKNPLYYMMFLSLYHQLVAGPVVRYADIAREIESRSTTIVTFSEGASRFITGLAKKVLIANVAGELCVSIMDGDINKLTVGGAWLGALFFSFQIYYDFSGYSDMAIGLGRMFGFTYKENFNYPYIATSVTDFWRRWHISLSSFFRDYLYIPLGGNRKNGYFNLLVVWLLTGLWHGASWNFVIWGLFFGVFITIERLFLQKLLSKLPKFIGHIYLIPLVAISWVIFYFTDIDKLLDYLAIMLGFAGAPLWDISNELTLMGYITWIAIAILFCMPIAKVVKIYLAQRATVSKTNVLLVMQIIFNVALLLICTARLVGQSYNPFLYYRF